MSVHPVDGSGGAPQAGAPVRPVTIHDLARRKAGGERFAVVTAHDASSGRLADEAGIEVVLVGDSLAMVALGHASTLPITLDEMLHHTRAVVRGVRSALVITDLPFGTYQDGPSQALASATRVLKESGAAGVKLEGGGRTIASTELLVASGIPVMGHLGLTPQSVHQFGGFRVQGRDEAAAERLVDDARRLEEAGAFSVVLEAIPAPLGQRVTEALTIPTIGIGAGPATDAQVLVWHDLLGLTAGRAPRFVKRYAQLDDVVRGALRAYRDEVVSGAYPAPEHTYAD